MNSLTRKNLGLIVTALLVLIVIISSIFITKHYKANSHRMSLSQALENKQFRIEVRKGMGQFEIKPFKFSEIDGRNLKLYFKNEGRNEVSVNFYKSDGKSKTEKHLIILPGEEGEAIFEAKIDDEEYSINIVDTTEPFPVVIGEFLLTDTSEKNLSLK